MIYKMKNRAGTDILILCIASCLLLSLGTTACGEGTAPPVPENSIFRPKFETTVGTFEAGTAFICRIGVDRKLFLITAHHLFGLNGGFLRQYGWDELPKLVKHVRALSITDRKKKVWSRAVIPIQGARAGRGVRVSNDLAAFLIDDPRDLGVLELAYFDPNPGTTVWLHAEIIDRGPEKGLLHAATVVRAGRDSIVYEFHDSKLNLRATSGAPILNKGGKVVALNAGAGRIKRKLVGIGNPASSIRRHLESIK